MPIQYWMPPCVVIVDCDREVAKNCMYFFLTDAGLVQIDVLQHIYDILKRKCASGSKEMCEDFL